MDINNPIFQNEDSARHYLETVRWPEGPCCPHCGEAENVMRSIVLAFYSAVAAVSSSR